MVHRGKSNEKEKTGGGISSTEGLLRCFELLVAKVKETPALLGGNQKLARIRKAMAAVYILGILRVETDDPQHGPQKAVERAHGGRGEEATCKT